MPCGAAILCTRPINAYCGNVHMSNRGKPKIGTLLTLAIVATLVAACSTQTAAIVGELELPDYRVGHHRVDEPLDMYIEPQILALTQKVTPQSSKRSYDPISVAAGEALDHALVGVTRQHFSNLTRVSKPQSRPTLSFALLTYRPVVTVKPGVLTTALNVSARIAIDMQLTSAIGEVLFSNTVIGTSHVSDKNISPGSGLSDAARLIEVATRDAIIDAMYDISRALGSNNDFFVASIRNGSRVTPVVVESIDGAVLQLRTRRELESLQ